MSFIRQVRPLLYTDSNTFFAVIYVSTALSLHERGLARRFVILGDFNKGPSKEKEGVLALPSLIG